MNASSGAGVRRSGWRDGFLALIIYIAIALLFFGRALWTGLTIAYVGDGPDPPQSIWFLGWWAHVLTERVNPFLTNSVWAPATYNLAWTTTMPLAGWLMYPVTRSLGPVAAYNLLCLICPAVVGWAAFVLCRHVTRNFFAALFGGFIFGFSPYMVCKLLGDIDLAMVPMVPIAAYLALRAFDGTIRKPAFVILFALALAAQFLLFIETF